MFLSLSKSILKNTIKKKKEQRHRGGNNYKAPSPDFILSCIHRFVLMNVYLFLKNACYLLVITSQTLVLLQCAQMKSCALEQRVSWESVSYWTPAVRMNTPLNGPPRFHPVASDFIPLNDRTF